MSTQWLADHLGADGLVVLDASVVRFTNPNGKPGNVSGHEQYLLEGHIPGAVFADLFEELSDPDGRYPFSRPSAQRFAAAAGELGIDNATTVVVYDSAVGQWASRVWWLFRAFGYDDVAVLDGGLTSWKQEERALETGHVQAETAAFTVTERPELWVDKAYVEGVLRGEHEAALVCAAPPQEFSGEAVPRKRGGHIPGSSSVPAARLVDRDTRHLPRAGEAPRHPGARSRRPAHRDLLRERHRGGIGRPCPHAARRALGRDLRRFAQRVGGRPGGRARHARGLSSAVSSLRRRDRQRAHEVLAVVRGREPVARAA